MKNLEESKENVRSRRDEQNEKFVVNGLEDEKERLLDDNESN